MLVAAVHAVAERARLGERQVRAAVRAFHEVALGLRRRTGRDRAVVEFMERTESSRAFMNRLEEYIRYVVPYYIAEGKSYLTVAIGCTGGRHRSVMIAERLRKALADVGVARVRVRHRDIRHA